MANEATARDDQDISTDPVSKEVAARLASELRRVAQLAETEEDLRIAAEAKLRDALTRLGIPTKPSYERTYANHAGRSDAVYGRWSSSTSRLVLFERKAVSTTPPNN